MNVPYQSTSAAKSLYYMRAGSDFMPVPHGVLAGMFGKRPQPSIKCELVPVSDRFSRREGGATAGIAFLLKLTNVGRGIASDIHLSVELVAQNTANMQIVFLDDKQWSIRRSSNALQNWIASNGGFQRQVPNETIDALYLHLNVPAARNLDVLLILACGSSESADSRIEYRWSGRELDRIAQLILHDANTTGQKQMSYAEAVDILRGVRGEWR